MSGFDVLEILYPENNLGLEPFETQEMMEVERLVLAVPGAPGDCFGGALPIVPAHVIYVPDSRGLLHGAVQLTAEAGTVEKGAHAQAQGGKKPARNRNHITGHNLLEILTTDYRPAADGVNEPLCGIQGNRIYYLSIVSERFCRVGLRHRDSEAQRTADDENLDNGDKLKYGQRDRERQKTEVL
jgi:hypothetical protein